jgi:hypothetical protein
MAIFARLVLLLFGILFSAGLGGAIAATCDPSNPASPPVAAAAGAVAGIFVGRALGNIVVGKPPKD